MMLGVRWNVGDPPHSSVPTELHEVIAAEELVHPGASAWTLTWLEGRPRAQLDDVLIVETTRDGKTRVLPLTAGDARDIRGVAATDDNDNDDWLD